MPIASADELDARCRAIELLVLDVDGVLTDGVIAVDDRGRRDQALPRPGRRRDRPLAEGGQAGGDRLGPVGPVRRGPGRRAGDLPGDPGGPGQAVAVPGVLAASSGSSRARSARWATTWPTSGCSGASGLAACPADAAAEVVEAAATTSARAPGGRGAVREVVEAILRRQGLWDGLVDGLSRRRPDPGGIMGTAGRLEDFLVTTVLSI